MKGRHHELGLGSGLPQPSSDEVAEVTRQFAGQVAKAFSIFRGGRVIEEPKVGVLDMTGQLEEGPNGELRIISAGSGDSQTVI